MTGLCKCFRKVNKHGKTCCQMCWIGYGAGQHSRLCNRRNPITTPERYNGE